MPINLFRKNLLFTVFTVVAAISIAAVFAILSPKSALAANPTTINFQGKVVNASGTNVADGTYTFSFRLYNTSATNPNTLACTADATCKWEETQASVTVTSGIFQVELGTSCSFFVSNACNNSAPIDFSSANALYLTMKFNSDGNGYMTPMIHFNSIPYAYYSNNSGSLGGIAAANYVQLANGLQTDTSSTNASIAINKTGGSANILTLQQAGADAFTVSNSGSVLSRTIVNSSTAFQVQSSTSQSIVTISTISNGVNLLTNSNFESNTSGWAALNGSTLSTISTPTQSGTQSLQAVLNAANVSDGVKYTYNFKPNTSYSLSVYAAITSGTTATFEMGTVQNGGAQTSCGVTGVTLTGSLTRYTCSFTTGATTTGSDYYYFKRTTAAAGTLVFDAAQLEVSAAATSFVDQPNPNLIQNSSIESNANGWSAKGSSVVSASSDFANFGNQSLKTVTTAATTDGAKYSYSLSANTRYSFNLFAKADSSIASILGRQENGSDVETSCAGFTVTTSWQQFSCTFTTGSTVNSTTNIYLRQTTAGVHSIYIDGVTLTASGSSQTFTQPATSLQADPLYGNLSLNNSNIGEIQPWQASANALPGARSYHTSVVANGYVYVIGGSNGSYQSTVFYAKLNADGSTGAWVTSSNSLPVILGLHTSIYNNGYVYVIGGYNGTFQSSVYYSKLNADGSNGAWVTSNNPLPEVRADHASIVANGYVYVIGGDATGPSSRSTVLYAKLNADGSTGAWVTSARPLTGISHDVQSVVANGYVYVTGTSTNNVLYAKLNADGSTGAWANASALPEIRYQHSLVATNGYIYEIGGNSGGYKSTVFYAKLNADGSTGAWATNTNALPDLRGTHTSVVSNGYIYTIGGQNATTTQATVYYASTSRILLGGNLDLVGLSGQSLGDPGNNGGSLTAGNTSVLGNLDVRDNASFTQNLGIGGSLNVGSGATIRGANGSTTIMNIQNAGNVSLVNISTVNLIANSSFEGGSTNVDNGVDGWIKKLGTETSIKLQTTAPQFGTQSLELITTTATGEGVKYPISNLAASTQYTLSFYAKVSTGSFATLTFGRSDTGVVGGDTSCVTTGSLTTSFARYNCTFTTGATLGASGTPYLYITKGTDVSVRTLYIDAVQLETGASMTDYRSGDISVDALATFKSSSNSTTAFQVQNSSGNKLFSVDSVNNQVSIVAVAAPTADILTVDNSGFGTSTNAINGVSVKFATAGTTASADNAGLRIDATSGNSGATTTLEGLKIADLTSPQANSTETGMYIGTGWDIGLDLRSGGIQLAAQNDPVAPGAGLIRLYAKNIAGRTFIKTVGSSGVDTALQNALWQNNTVIWTPSTAAGVWQGATGGAVGTAAVQQPTTTNLYTSERRSTYAPLTAAANIQMGIRSDAQFFHGNVAGNGGFFMAVHFGTDTWTAGERLFVGMGVCTTACTTVNPSTLLNIAGFGIDAGDTAISFMHNDGVGAATKDTIAGQPTLSSNQGYDAYIFMKPNDSTIYYRLDDTNAAVTIIDTSTATDIVAVNTMLIAHAEGGSGTNTVIANSKIGINRIYVETDH